MTLAELPITDSAPAPGEDTPVGPRRRVLLSAFAVSPVRGSEAAVGWHICRLLARHHDVDVLLTPGCDEHNRDALTTYLKQNGPIPGLNFHFVDPPPLSRLLQRDNGVLGLGRATYYMGYAAWQRAALRRARELHARKPFDVAHQLNIIGYREPSYLWKLPVPFVWGPVGGASNLPWSYFPLLRGKDRFIYGLRNVANEWQKRTSLRCRKAARAAKKIWVIGEDNHRMVTGIWNKPAENMLETGAMARAEACVHEYDPARPLKVVWSGLHIGRKALPILLRALAALKGTPAVELTVLGEGPETNNWMALAKRLGLNNIQLLGNVSHAQALSEMAKADLFAFTSLQEGTPHVVLESLSLGLPVVCHEASGAGVAVTPACGIKVNMTGPDDSVRQFADAFRRIYHDPAEVKRLSQGAILRSQELSWENLVLKIATAYHEVLNASPHETA